MKKPKSTEQQKARNKRGYKRTLRLKASRKKVAERQVVDMLRKKEEKIKFNDFLKKLQEARAKGNF